MDFSSEISRAAGLFEAGKLVEAAEIFRQLSTKEDLDRTGRIIATINLAVTYDKMGHADHAVSTYEYGMGIATEDYLLAQGNRATYLHKIGRVKEAVRIWEHLLTLEFLSPEREKAYRHNIEVSSNPP